MCIFLKVIRVREVLIPKVRQSLLLLISFPLLKGLSYQLTCIIDHFFIGHMRAD